MMGSTQADGVASEVVNGAKGPHGLHESDAQENPFTGKSSPSNVVSNYFIPREPLAHIALGPNRTRHLAQPGHNRVEELGKRGGSMSRSGSEADSLLDLYKQNASHGSFDINELDHDVPENMYQPEDDDPEGWIHRDKLAKIESEELQAAGINLATTRQNGSQIGRRGSGRDGHQPEALGAHIRSRPTGDEKRQRVSSPVSRSDAAAESKDWDLRNPEEIASESAPSTPAYPNPVVRKAGSKIPILTSSPLPIPHERLERDTPLPRKRTMSGSIGPDDRFLNSRAFLNNKTRPRPSSAGSQILLDDAEPIKGSPALLFANAATSPSNSKPTNDIHTPSPVTASVRKPTPTSRNVSATIKAGAPLGSRSSPIQRPATRSGDTDRPRTALNRPEGDPPWLATMYKPDPMLPPDEQIIPTHARRQQQAQWDENGAVPNVYGRDFSPLAVHVNDPPRPKQLTPPIVTPEQLEDDKTTWPLKPMLSVRSTSSGRPGTSGSNTGGYSTMPKVASPPLGVSSPKMAHTNSHKGSNQVQAPTRMQEQKLGDLEKQEEKTKEKGCGCCIVM